MKFHDPNQLLSGHEFCTAMVKLIEPLSIHSESQPPLICLNVKFLYGRYQKSSLTALCLGAYIVNLTLILHNLFIDMLTQEPPRPVTRELIDDTLQRYKASDIRRVHGLIRAIVDQMLTLHPEEKIADLIRGELGMETVK
ncbi:hypothetical protein D9758_005467 [Tetrapyrgos nigripes]|uniref:Uncharacterized protein n=1 Tax=Tetrapyrgos nigripes TaxID=182062 RepID=A0A8H5GHQ5_9AGAR|nr:hypothetical protein D9758_005467 [Tetrapyrgos nigripes]